MTIEDASNSELIAELLRRESFRGLIVFQKSNFKPGEPDTDWRWESRQCDPRKVVEQIAPAICEAETA